MQTVIEMDKAIRGIKPRNIGAIQLKKAWIVWFNHLSWYDKTANPRVQKDGRDRLVAFESVNGGSVFGAETERRTIRVGSTGPVVSMWQKFLGIPQTGTFDHATFLATVQYQRSKGLKSDGVVGKGTWDTVPEERSTGSLPVKKIAATGLAVAAGIGAAVFVDKKIRRRR